MILPPEEIKIKRKRTDDPVDVLRIHESRGKKQKCASDFVFYRQLCADSNNVATVSRTTHNNLAPTYKSLSHVPIDGQDDELVGNAKINNINVPRHFHISRSVATLDPIHSISSTNRKRKAETVFVERKPCPVLKSRLSYDTTTLPKSKASIQISSHPDKKVSRRVDTTSAPHCEAPSKAPLRSVCLPSGNVIPWDIKTQKLAAEMQAYTLSEISKNVAAFEAETPSNISKPNVPTTHISPSRQLPTRFKPKAPVLRYKDRNPNEQDINSNMDYEIEYVERDEGDSEDWVVETFLRRPLEDTPIENLVNFGFIVLDTEAEIEEFYQDDSDTEEEDEDDDDENAENHYSADYPEDEVASDDEFDRNAYYYTNNLDEYEAYSSSADEPDEKYRYPWMQKPWVGRRVDLDLDNARKDEDN